MPKFIKKPIPVEAFQTPHRDILERLVREELVPRFMLSAYRLMDWREQHKFIIKTRSGYANGKTGDYLVQSPVNPDDVYPVDQEEFDATYEAYSDDQDLPRPASASIPRSRPDDTTQVQSKQESNGRQNQDPRGGVPGPVPGFKK